MTQSTWSLAHSVETQASHDFAWAYMTDVKNWEDPPARFELRGPFAPGSKGLTHVPGQEPISWRLRDVRAPHSYAIEMDLDGAALRFEWRFEPTLDTATKLTQTIELSGPSADAHAEAVQAGFGTSLAHGMERIAVAIATAFDDQLKRRP